MNIQNDSSMSVEDAMAKVEINGVRLKYGDIELAVEGWVVDSGHREVALIDSDERPGVMLSVDRALQSAVKYINKRQKSNRPLAKTRMDNFCHDLVLWACLKDIMS